MLILTLTCPMCAIVTITITVLETNQAKRKMWTRHARHNKKSNMNITNTRYPYM